MSRNKFGFGPLEDPPAPKPRRREVGPMGAAVREAASSLSESTEGLVEQRRQNAADAKAWRIAQDEGRVLVSLRLDTIRTDADPRVTHGNAQTALLLVHARINRHPPHPGELDRVAHQVHHHLSQAG